jgi:serine/threonine-protein kinase
MVFLCTTCKREVDTPGQFCPFCGTAAPTPTHSADPLVGRKVAGKYFVHQQLGKGGMGLVYKCTDVVLDRPVALKVLDRALLADGSMVQRFHREARAASRLNHPNCITILDFGQFEDGQLYIAMEFLAGRSLSRVVAEDFPIPHDRVVRMVAQILAALGEAHAAGVIHRDLKLSNVMVESRRDEHDFVKVLDFGIAKLTVSEGGAELTTAGMICGTPGYMSPEQARGEELDPRSDLYSVGIILYELLTGSLPFQSETPMGLAVKHMTEAPVSPRKRRTELVISPALDDVVMRALSKDREDRFASAEEMRTALLGVALAGAAAARATPRPASPSTMVIPATPRPRHPAPVRRVEAEPAGADAPEADEAPPDVDAAKPATPAPRPARKATPAPRATPRPAARRQRPAWFYAAIVAGVVLVVGVVAALAFDPFAAPKAPPAPDEGLALPRRAAAPSPATTPGAGTPAVPSTAATAPAVTPPASTVAQATAQPAPTPVPPLPPPPTPAKAPAPVKAAPQPEPEAAPAPPAKQAKPAVAKGSGVLEVAEGLSVLKLPGAASGQGLLVLIANPWGTVYVDGKELGETPRELRVGAGYYRVKIVHPNKGTREERVVVHAGQRAMCKVDFDR